MVRLKRVHDPFADWDLGEMILAHLAEKVGIGARKDFDHPEDQKISRVFPPFCFRGDINMQEVFLAK